MTTATGMGMLLAALAVAGPAAPSARAAGTPPEAARLEAALRGVRSLRIDFVQIRDVALTGESIEARGLIAFRPPSQFRLAYDPPHPQEIVIEGDTLWVVMPSENQAQRYPFSADAPGSELFLLFGASDKKLTDVYRVVQEPWGSYANALRLFPLKTDAGDPVEEIRVVVGKDGFPDRLFFKEVTGDTVVFTFTRVVRNPPDIEDLVRLRLPPGIEILDAPPPERDVGLPIDPEQ